MGIRTDPGYELFGDDCGCFEPGQTPKKMWLTFSGMKACKRAILLGRKPPPNGTFICEQDPDIPCVWVSLSVDWAAIYVPDAVISIKYMPTFQDYFVTFIVGCATSGANFYTVVDCQLGGSDGYGGRVQAWWRPKTNSPSIKGIMKKLNMEPHRNTMFEGFPLDDTHAVAKYCRTRDATNIKIKFEI